MKLRILLERATLYIGGFRIIRKFLGRKSNMAKKEIIVIVELYCGGRVRIVTVGGDPLVSLYIFHAIKIIEIN